MIQLKIFLIALGKFLHCMDAVRFLPLVATAAVCSSLSCVWVGCCTWFAEVAISWGITLQYRNGAPLQLFPIVAAMEKLLVSPRKLPLSFLSGSKKDSLVALPSPLPPCPLQSADGPAPCITDQIKVFADFLPISNMNGIHVHSRNEQDHLDLEEDFTTQMIRFHCTFLIRICAGPCFLCQGASLQCLRH